MNREKFYKLLILVIGLVSIISSLILPYLHLAENTTQDSKYELNYDIAAMDSAVISKIAKEEGIAETIVYNIGKSIIQGKDEDSIKKRLIESEYYAIPIVRDAMNEKKIALEEIGPLNTTNFSFFETIDLANYVIEAVEQNILSGYGLLLSLGLVTLFTVLLIFFCIKKVEKYYYYVKIISLVNVILLVLGMICTNAMSIGALQLERFYKTNWGMAWYVLIILQILTFIIAFIGDLYRKYYGIITFKMILKQKQLVLMTVPFIIYAIIFNYGPLVGWTMAFQNYKPSQKGLQIWVGWDKFEALFTEIKFILAFRNTVAMSLINLVLSTTIAILFALLLNEVKFIKGKKLVQTISYLPHFLSWIIVAAIVRNVLSLDGGIVNNLLVQIGILNEPINFFANGKYFWWIVGASVVWKETGWNSIIYLASITSISPDLYESASIDGAGRFQKMKHITLPGIKPTIMVLLIINLGMIMNSGFEAQYQLKNDIINSTAEVIDTYVLNKSFTQGADWSIGTAAGIFKSVISIALITIANYLAKLFDQERLY